MLRRIIRRAVRFAYMLDVERAGHAADGRALHRHHGRRLPGAGRAASTRCVDLIGREEERFRQTLRPRLGRCSTPSWTPLPDGRRARRSGGLRAARHLRLPARGHPGDGRAARRRASTSTASTPRWPSSASAPGPRARAPAWPPATRSTPTRRVLAEHGATEFTGRDELTPPSAVVLAVVGDAVFLDRTPFYAESGGQVGDTGTITTPTGTVRVLDTTVRPARAAPPPRRGRRGHRRAPARTATAAIDVERRAPSAATTPPPTSCTGRCARCSGDHVKQQGSWVGPDRLRFDFATTRRSPPRRSAAIEDLANHEILANAPVRHFETTKDEARELGRDRVLRRQVRRRRARARGRPAQHRAVRRHPRAAPSATSARSRSSPRARSARTSAASRPSPASGPSSGCACEEARLAARGRPARRAARRPGRGHRAGASAS